MSLIHLLSYKEVIMIYRIDVEHSCKNIDVTVKFFKTCFYPILKQEKNIIKHFPHSMSTECLKARL